jgi:hypothetical protein
MSTAHPPALVKLLHESLRAGQQPVMHVVSDSMAPLLRKGDRVRVQGTTPETIEAGDIVVFETGDELVIHRFLGWSEVKGERVAVTRGDRLMVLDALSPATAILGSVAARYRDGRRLTLQKGPGRLLNRVLAGLSRFECRLYVLPAPPGCTPPSQELRWLLLRGREESLVMRALRRTIRWTTMALVAGFGRLGDRDAPESA